MKRFTHYVDTMLSAEEVVDLLSPKDCDVKINTIGTDSKSE